jgi:hypothetical protein
MNGEFIMIKNELFWELVETVIETTERKLDQKLEVKKTWLTPKQAMASLNVGKTTLYKLRISGKIRYTKSESSNKILYCSTSIEDYNSQNAVDSF